MVKALDFDSSICWFESSHPSHGYYPYPPLSERDRGDMDFTNLNYHLSLSPTVMADNESMWLSGYAVYKVGKVKLACRATKI